MSTPLVILLARGLTVLAFFLSALAFSQLIALLWHDWLRTTEVNRGKTTAPGKPNLTTVNATGHSPRGTSGTSGRPACLGEGRGQVPGREHPATVYSFADRSGWHRLVTGDSYPPGTKSPAGRFTPPPLREPSITCCLRSRK